MKAKLVIDIQGEEVFVLYFDRESFERSRHVIEDRLGKVLENDDRIYASVHDEIPFYTNQAMNGATKGGKLW